LSDIKRTELSVRRERALLVGAILPNGPDGHSADDPLVELESLALTAGAHVVGTIRQRIRRPDPAYYIGRGKS
jgi:GTP-binding protein HflX